MNEKQYLIEKYGEEQVEEWLDSVKMEDLMNCMDAFSSDSFNGDLKQNIHTKKWGYEWNTHREKHLNILEMILQETPNGLYGASTYGIRPNETCTDAIGYITGRKYGNLEIATFLIREKIEELKKWLLKNYDFSIREEKLLHFFKERKGVIFDEEDNYYDHIDRFDFEMWFDNSASNKKFIITGKAERWDIKGERAYGYIDRVFDSILDAIDGAMDGCGICYVKIHENPFGRLFVDVRHHDGYNEFEIRELTAKGEKRLYNADYDEDIVKTLLNTDGYTKNVHWRKNY